MAGKKEFLGDDFLLSSPSAVKLYHDHAAKMPIYDFHCHLSPQQLAENKPFENITQLWLAGDHYKWRAMRANGVPEKYCTGDASDWDKFLAWARTVPATIGNPLYHWTHLELQRYFGISGKLLNKDTAKEIYRHSNSVIREQKMAPYAIFKKMRVKVLCTTDDPADSLEYHRQIASTGKCPARVYPTFRPDKVLAVEDPKAFNAYVDRLAAAWGRPIGTYHDLLAALKARHDYFHSVGCRLSDHGMEAPEIVRYTDADITQIFSHIRENGTLDHQQRGQFKTALLVKFGQWNAAAGWVMQLHIGALRNNRTRMLKSLGPDTGFDSIADLPVARPLSQFLDMLDARDRLPRTILYCLNPKDNEVLAAMAGNFQDGAIPGKMQFGSAWWFLDQQDGIEKQLTALASLGLLSRFVGMLTDSRSLLSYPRHEYFRRILCNWLGRRIDNGEIPGDLALVGSLVKDICYNNAVDYFGLKL